MVRHSEKDMSDGTSTPSAPTVGGAWLQTMCAMGSSGVLPPSSESARERCRTWLIHAPPRFSAARAKGSTKIYAAASPARRTSRSLTAGSQVCAPSAAGATSRIVTPNSRSTSPKSPASTRSSGRNWRTASSSKSYARALSFSDQ